MANRHGRSPKEVRIVMEVFVSGISSDRPQASLTNKRSIWSDNATHQHAAASPTNFKRAKVFSKFSVDEAEAKADNATLSAPYL